jgi:hypothetical protein
MELDPQEPVLETVVDPAPELAPEPAPEPAPIPEAAQPQAVAPEPTPTEPFWYRKALRAQEDRQKAQDREIRELRSRLEQAQPANPAPHPLDDPDAYAREFDQRLDRTRFALAEQFSRRLAIRDHGAELQGEVDTWLRTRPDVMNWAAQQDDMWDAAISQFKREKLASEIGDNPDDWRNKERERIRAEVEAELASAPSALATPAGNPTPPRIPTPASTQRSANPRDSAGRYTGPAPLTEITRTKWT